MKAKQLKWWCFVMLLMALFNAQDYGNDVIHGKIMDAFWDMICFMIAGGLSVMYAVFAAYFDMLGL